LKYIFALVFGLYITNATAQTVQNPQQIALTCAYNSEVPTPVAGSYFFVQCDSAGKLLTNALTPDASGNVNIAGYLSIKSNIFLYGNTANVLSQYNGTSGQNFDIFGTWSSAGVNYERVRLGWNSSLTSFSLLSGSGGTGISRHLDVGTDSTSSGNLYFTTTGSRRWNVSGTTGDILPQSDDDNNIGGVSNRIRALWLSRALISSGASPTGSGTCPINTQLGGNLAGAFKADGACVGGTITLTMLQTVPNGFACTANDLTTPATLIKQTAYTTTSVTFTVTGTMASGDNATYQCTGF
jgi:hypothetical protein